MGMKLDPWRWILLPIALAAMATAVIKGFTPKRVALAAACAAVWYLLSRRKARSLDGDRFGGGKLLRR